MKHGDMVKCIGARTVSNLTAGRVYTTLDYEPKPHPTHVDWASNRAWITVLNDIGQRCMYHADRFELVKENTDATT